METVSGIQERAPEKDSCAQLREDDSPEEKGRQCLREAIDLDCFEYEREVARGETPSAWQGAGLPQAIREIGGEDHGQPEAPEKKEASTERS